jgi:hypothetical protein
MHCLRKTVLYGALVALFVPLMSTAVEAQTLALTSATVSPTTGNIYSDSTAISIYVNSGTDEFAGVDIDLAYTGSIQYLSGTGAARCSTFTITPGSGTLNILCLSTQHTTGQAYSGVIATLYFKSTASSGTATLSFTSVDPNAPVKTGGTYTLTSATNPNAGQGGLPDSGLFDDSRSLMVLGAILIFLGFFWNKVANTGILFMGKLKSVQEDVKERETAKRRSRVEKGF